MPQSADTPTAPGADDLVEAVAPVKRIRARRGEGERLREEILDAAEKLLMETGDAEEVSIRAISQMVMVSAPSIYRHFEDKDALVLAVCERAYNRFGDYLNAGAAAHHGPLGEIMGRALAYVRFALDNPGQYRVLFMTPGAHVHKDFAHDSFDLESSEMRGLVDLVRAVENAIKEGMVRPIASALEMSILLWSQVHGIASLRIAHPEMPWPPAEQQVETMFAFLAEGLCTPLATQRFAEFKN
jgi:AcrR family transcriptional regulator